jgi:hypothetical protein
MEKKLLIQSQIGFTKASWQVRLFRRRWANSDATQFWLFHNLEK